MKQIKITETNKIKSDRIKVATELIINISESIPKIHITDKETVVLQYEFNGQKIEIEICEDKMEYTII